MGFEAGERRRDGDPWLLLLTLVLVGCGLVMVLSASQALAYLQHLSPFYYLERQAIGAALGTAALVAFSRFDYHRLRRLALPLAGAVTVLMLLVMVPGVGVMANGARRWLDLGPLGSFQPSEVAKLAFAVFICCWIEKRQRRLLTFADGFVPFAILLVAALGLLALQKDLGTALVMAAIFASAYFAGGGRKRYLLLLLGGLALVFLVLTLVEPYRAGRLATWRNPFADPLGAGFQSSQAILALGNGGLTGVGLGHSVEKFLWLPEAHTDFIFAIVGEETGLIGTTIVLAAFVAFAARGYRVAIRAPDRLGLMLATAITTWIAFQALLNMATVTDTLPITGVPLPFFSYGGTSVAATLAAIGVLLNIAGQSRRQSNRGNERGVPAKSRVSWGEDRRLDAAADRGRGDRWAPVPGPGGGASVPR
jgi:cell division protein FtsW